MGMEKFVRSKPHVNIGTFIKQKLGFGAPPPEQPPIEPDAASEVAAAQEPDAALPRVGWETNVGLIDGEPAATALDAVELPGDESDPDKLYRVKVKFPDVDGQDSADDVVLDDGSGQQAFNPKEITIDKDVPWQKGSLPEHDDEVIAGFEHGDSNQPYVVGGLWNDESAPDESQAATQNDLRMMKSRSGHLLETDDGEDKALGAQAGSDVNIQHDHVYQHNQSDLEFATERASTSDDSDPDKPVLSKLDNADKPAEDGPGDVGMIRPGNYQTMLPPTADDSDEPTLHGDPPGVDDEASTLVDLDASEHLEPLGGHDLNEAVDADSVDDAAHHLSDRLHDLD
ncbi:MAG TPA: phage baseplate assembly protein V [Dehalococcoidia bacterium]